jgi:hypothetical protein
MKKKKSFPRQSDEPLFPLRILTRLLWGRVFSFPSTQVACVIVSNCGGEEGEAQVGNEKVIVQTLGP